MAAFVGAGSEVWSDVLAGAAFSALAGAASAGAADGVTATGRRDQPDKQGHPRKQRRYSR